MKGKMDKNTKIVLFSLTALSFLVVIFALLNRSYIEPMREAQRAGVFFLLADDRKHAVSIDDFEDFSPFDIDANYKTSGLSARNRTFRGVSFSTIAASFDIDISAYRFVLFTAADGYASMLTSAEAMDAGNCYIVAGEEGRPLGTLEEGGMGPFMMILAHDAFSQRWCKYLLEVKLLS